jgi:hypothetical protein
MRTVDAMMYQHTLLAIKSKQRAQQNQKMGEVDRIEIEED